MQNDEIQTSFHTVEVPHLSKSKGRAVYVTYRNNPGGHAHAGNTTSLHCKVMAHSGDRIDAIWLIRKRVTVSHITIARGENYRRFREHIWQCVLFACIFIQKL